MKLVIGSDKSGFQLKEAVMAYLLAQGHEVLDVGTRDPERPMGFFLVAPQVAERVASGEYERGILCCGTGMGMSIVANKYQGIVASACESVYSAKMCRAVNNANILCMGGWLIADWLGVEMTKVFLQTTFTQDLDDRREWLQKAQGEVQALEERIYGGKNGN